jgi:hypothetical protein
LNARSVMSDPWVRLAGTTLQQLTKPGIAPFRVH